MTTRDRQWWYTFASWPFFPILVLAFSLSAFGSIVLEVSSSYSQSRQIDTLV